LAIVRHLVEQHGGTVSATSEGTGLGSTFGFTLPVVESPRRHQIVEAPPAATSSNVLNRRCTILIVDDEPDNREVIRSIIHDVLGHIAVTAADGEEALLRARANLDLILLDLRMPGLSGFEVARRLKAQPSTSEIPILAITAFNEEQDLDEARAAGCLGCITKPFTNETLAAAVSSVLAAAGSGADR
jgi:CheY-like chemotaxis protein